MFTSRSLTGCPYSYSLLYLIMSLFNLLHKIITCVEKSSRVRAVGGEKIRQSNIKEIVAGAAAKLRFPSFPEDRSK